MNSEFGKNYYLDTRQAYVQRFTLIYSSICLLISCYFTPQDFNWIPAVIVNLLLFLIAAPYWFRKKNISNYLLNVISQVSNVLASIWICSFLGPTSHINMVAIPQFLLVLMMFGRKERTTRYILAGTCVLQLLLPLVPFVDEWYKEKRMIESNLVILRALIDLSILIISTFQFKHVVENWKGIVSLAEDEKLKFQKESEWRHKLIKILGHDIKEPMVYSLQLIRKSRKESQDPSLVKYFNQIENALVSMREVISNVESFSFDTEVKDFPRVHVNVHEVLQRIIPWQKTRLEEKGITLDLSEVVQEHSLFVMADPFIYQIFNNLFINAIKFSPHNSKIIIKTNLDENNIMKWLIQDFGQGIKPSSFEDNNISTIGTDGEIGSSLGIKIAQTFAKKENISISWESSHINPSVSTTGTVVILSQNLGTLSR